MAALPPCWSVAYACNIYVYAQVYIHNIQKPTIISKTYDNKKEITSVENHDR